MRSVNSARRATTSDISREKSASGSGVEVSEELVKQPLPGWVIEDPGKIQAGTALSFGIIRQPDLSIKSASELEKYRRASEPRVNAGVDQTPMHTRS